MSIKDIDEINMYPVGDGNFEVHIHTWVLDEHETPRAATIKFPCMSLNINGLIGETNSVMYTIELKGEDPII